jgi:hypothetical protein
MTVDRKNRRVRQEAGSKGGLMRTKPLEPRNRVSRPTSEETPIFDFSELLRIMPKRKKNGVKPRAGTRARSMLKYITTPGRVRQPDGRDPRVRPDAAW